MENITVNYQTTPFYAGVCGKLECSCPYAESLPELKDNMMRMIRTHPKTRKMKKRLEELTEFKEVPSFLVACPD